MHKYDIFLSYSHGKQDKLIPQAYRIYKMLTDAGFTVWFDLDQIKSSEPDVKKSMRSGINNSTVFLTLLSPDYMQSYNCNYEFAHANAKRKPIVTCKVKSGSYKTGDFHHITPFASELIPSHSLKNLLSILTPFFMMVPRPFW